MEGAGVIGLIRGGHARNCPGLIVAGVHHVRICRRGFVVWQWKGYYA